MPRPDAASGFPHLDRTARLAYGQRMLDLRSDVDGAIAEGDLEAEARAREEMEWLGRELALAYGLGQRERRGPAPAERARQSVTKAIRVAIDRIEGEDADLARHLDRTVRTGTFCSYDPDPGAGLRWHI